MENKYLINNYFGMSIENQVRLMDEIMNTTHSNNKTRKKFYKVFGGYYEKISYLLKQQKLYNTLNSNQRRTLRLKTIEHLGEKVQDYPTSDSYENKKIYFAYNYGSEFYIGEYVNEFNSYFYPQKISDKTAEEYIERIKNLSINDKYEFLNEFFYHYSRFDFFTYTIPNPKELINLYDSVVLNVIGDELFEYYKKMFINERVSFINDIAVFIEEIKTSAKKAMIINDKDAVKKQKIKCLEDWNYYMNN